MLGKSFDDFYRDIEVKVTPNEKSTVACGESDDSGVIAEYPHDIIQNTSNVWRSYLFISYIFNKCDLPKYEYCCQ